ncbi:O-antigen ligase family protein [Merismopedia glauca]|uniref:O-antigen ligase-related domain-containing protein n=1 Tax=Merismopedia glauca CCAP 1448/3 TaxID=1296344 RepID=A0A2T1C4I6_9CYAN|nr:O-antigen ligase family protein [Merismopedia glauca]PSB03068.1 hypothetical protein C7B64_10040 [Merismopedia glauca CCAP 1448/3]
MSVLTYLAMFGWIPAIIYLFQRYQPQKAVIIAFIAAWLFLPKASFPVIGLPDYTKISATCYGIVLATLAFDIQRFKKIRFSWIDIPLIVFSLQPFISSITNDLGPYDGISSSLAQIVRWGIPYLLGRIYFDSLDGLKKLAVAIFIGGLMYTPLCLIEIRLSPILHRTIYGFEGTGRSFVQAIRLGGYRPSVFMEHGLAVGMWMMAASVIGISLWKTGVIKQLWNIDIKLFLICLVATFILVKSTGAYLLFVLGLCILFSAWYWRNKLLLIIFSLAICYYLFLGASGNITTARIEQIVSFTTSLVGEDRAQSLEFRLSNEQILGDRARERPLTGWGGWGRNQVYDEATGKQLTTTDSLWIIAFGTGGIIGLVSLTAFMLLPSLMFCLRCYPPVSWSHPKVAPAATLAIIMVLYMFDCISNAMINPIFTLASGGISGVVVKHIKDY